MFTKILTDVLIGIVIYLIESKFSTPKEYDETVAPLKEAKRKRKENKGPSFRH